MLTVFNKWTARIALAVLLLSVLMGIGLIPVHTNHQTVWPLSYHFGSGHTIACIEIVAVYVIVGLAILWFGGLTCLCVVGELIDRAFPSKPVKHTAADHLIDTLHTRHVEWLDDTE